MEQAHLTSNHRDTLSQIFQHPVSHNVEWHAVLSLLGQVGTISERHDGRYEVTLGGEKETLDKPKHKDVDAQMVVDLRRMLTEAGYAPEDFDSHKNG